MFKLHKLKVYNVAIYLAEVQNSRNWRFKSETQYRLLIADVPDSGELQDLTHILYATPAWWGFANSSDKKRLEVFLRRCARLHFYRQEAPTVTELVEDLEEQLFTNMLTHDHHLFSYNLTWT